MTALLLFVICLAATTLCALVGAGGGIIIKPAVDLLGVLPVSTVSFLSSCTVLVMSSVSLLRTRGNGVRLRMRTSTPLAVGGAAGGLAGKHFFELVRSGFGDERALGFIQALVLMVLTVGVLIYICNKRNIPGRHVESPVTAGVIGLILGTLSSFLGIGGGPINVSVLFFFFSMEAREAVKNSLYIIIFAQLTNILASLTGGTVPVFHWVYLLCMAAGGVGGALLGAAISKRINDRQLENALKVLCIIVICVNVYNALRFSLG